MNVKDLAKKFNIPTEDVVLIENILSKGILSENNLLNEVISYTMSAQGKMIRPFLCLFIFYAFGGDKNNVDKVINSAVAIELMHISTLLHDDVIDNGALRRDKNTVNRKWGDRVSILSGDFIISKSLQFILKTENIKVIELLCDSAFKLIEGEFLQMEMEGVLNDKSVYNYFKMIEKKTSPLFCLACHVGLLFSGNTEDLSEKVIKFGNNIGIIFQILDDILDYGAGHSFGKKFFSDIKGGKITLPLIVAYEESSDDEKNVINKFLKKRSESDIDKILDLIYKNNSLEKARSFAIKKAEENIEIIKTTLKSDLICKNLLYFMKILIDREN
ncbi:polyprenyl synthetase family protein [Anaplasmataceae bacterium AB001_6]|nr:polyprenyl synthetase family protein [Anaplasmataceae bacterium AB001_6]